MLFVSDTEWLAVCCFLGIRQQLVGMGLVGNWMTHKQEIVISDCVFAGSLAATGGGLSMETERKQKLLPVQLARNQAESNLM